MKRAAWIVIACAAALSLFAAGAAAQQLEVIRDARMRAQPDNNAKVVGYAKKGAIVPLIEENGSWYKIQYNGDEGWIFRELAHQRSNAGEIFTQQGVDVPPPMLESEESRVVKYALITKNNTLIYANIKDGPKYSPVLHTVRNKGEVFILIGEGSTWSTIEYVKDGDTAAGYVLSSSVEILDAPPTKSTIVKEFENVVIGLVACGALILIVSGIITIRHIRADRQSKVYVQKNALIMAKESKHVQYMLTNSTATMEHCFTEIGFNVSVAKDSVTARKSIDSSMPDLIMVDWNFETAIFAKIDNLFARMAQPDSTYFLFYNVPDPSAVPPVKALRNVSFLGLTVSDRDIFKVVTPLLVHHEADSPKDLQKGLQRCALEGEIAGGNLLEVLQFIEIGSKTGCLMVETKGPFGLVYFRDGMIIYAAAAKGQGVEAVYSILNQPFGKFRFITNKQPKTANLNLPTLSVLMEWTKEKDEAGRG